jgi:hypothetical protein
VSSKIKFLICLAAVSFLFWLAIGIANADVSHHNRGDVDVLQSNDMNNQTAGDVNSVLESGSYESKALALSNVLGDVDIRSKCLASTQWGTPLFSKQKLARDFTCLGFEWLALGAYENAMIAFCMDKDTLERYGGREPCEAAHNFEFVVIVQPPESSAGAAEPPAMAAESEDDDDYYEEQFLSQQVEIATAKQDLQAVERRLFELEHTKADIKPVEKQSGLTENQRNALAQVLDK